MVFLPAVRKKIMRKRTERMLHGSMDLSIESFIGKKLDHFFEKLGSHDAQGLYETVISQVERPMIEKALEWSKGNRLRASRLLGINRNTLRQKMLKLKIKKAEVKVKVKKESV